MGDDAYLGKAIDCCLWKVFSHSERSHIKGWIEGGTSAREAIEKALLTTGEPRKGDLAAVTSMG
jgi:hypothetical protein